MFYVVRPSLVSLARYRPFGPIIVLSRTIVGQLNQIANVPVLHLNLLNLLILVRIIAALIELTFGFPVISL